MAMRFLSALTPKDDSDGDYLTDDFEIEIDTDPLDADSDDDGLLDGNEVSTGTDPLDADSDADGFTDGEEVFAGTNPLDRCPTPTNSPVGDWNARRRLPHQWQGLDIGLASHCADD